MSIPEKIILDIWEFIVQKAEARAQSQKKKPPLAVRQHPGADS